MSAPDAVALVFADPESGVDREYSVERLDALADGLAATLAGRGVRAGRRVAIMSSNRPEFVVAVRAVWKLGAAVVLLSPAWKRAEVEHALEITEPRWTPACGSACTAGSISTGCSTTSSRTGSPSRWP